MSMKKLLVLYRSEKEHPQTYCVYFGGAKEANDELEIMQKHDETLNEYARIELTTSAKLITENP